MLEDEKTVKEPTEKKILFIVLDGLGDRPCDELGGLTPLEAARTPVMNLLAEKGASGLVDVAGIGIRPGSDVGHLSLLGYDPAKYYPGRGPLEALGAGITLNPGDVAFRVNFATVDAKGKILDRRAGRIDSCKVFEPALEKIKLPRKYVFKTTIEHRGVLVLRGPGLSDKVSPNDNKHSGIKPTDFKPLDSTKEAATTAALLNDFVKQAAKLLDKNPENTKRKKKKLLPANYLLIRGAGEYKPLPSFKDRYNLTAAVVAGGNLYKGIARAVGMDVLEVRGATGMRDTNLLAKVLSAKNALLTHDFVFLHIKGTDEYGEDGDALGKKGFIERIDSALAELANLDKTLVVITGDHSTPCSLKAHSGDNVPILINGPGVRVDHIQKFGERDAGRGSLGRLTGLDVMPELLNLAGRAPMAGS